MIDLPRHVLVNMQNGIVAAIGPAASRVLLGASTDISALQWSRTAAKTKTHSLTPVEPFHHCLKRLSQRGCGLLAITALNEAVNRHAARRGFRAQVS